MANLKPTTPWSKDSQVPSLEATLLALTYMTSTDVPVVVLRRVQDAYRTAANEALRAKHAEIVEAFSKYISAPGGEPDDDLSDLLHSITISDETLGLTRGEKLSPSSEARLAAALAAGPSFFTHDYMNSPDVTAPSTPLDVTAPSTPDLTSLIGSTLDSPTMDNLTIDTTPTSPTLASLIGSTPDSPAIAAIDLTKRDPTIFFILTANPAYDEDPYYPSLSRPIVDSNRWYCITKGTAVGVIAGWPNTAPFVTGVPGNLAVMYKSCHQACTAYWTALQNGDVRIMG